MVEKRTSMTRLKGLWLICGVVTMLVTTGCQTNPYTGRWQLMMMPMSQEMQMGVQAYAEVKSDPKLKQSADPREIEPVKRVAARVIEAAKRSKYSDVANQFEWEVTVIKDDKTMNAFALPGGKIAVYTGIFPVAKTEAGLAAVMGHEVVYHPTGGAPRLRSGLPARHRPTRSSRALAS